MEYVKCDLCGADNYEVIWDKVEREKRGILRSVVIRDRDRNILNGRNVMCKQCGLVYVNPRMTKKELDEFYEKDYRKVYGKKSSLEAEKRHAKVAFQILGRGLPDFNDSGQKIYYKNFLDIGCSTGELVSYMRTNLGKGDAYGIEPNIEYYQKAKDRGLNIENTIIENYNPDIKFDIITMLNTLEHVISPSAVLRKICSLLNDKGYVLLCVPNLLSTHINIPVDAFLSNAHLYNFTPATLGIMMAQAGLKPVKMYPFSEEMGEKVYVLAQKSQPVEIIFDDNIEKRIEYTKAFLRHVDSLFTLKCVLNGGIK